MAPSLHSVFRETVFCPLDRLENPGQVATYLLTYLPAYVLEQITEHNAMKIQMHEIYTMALKTLLI